MDQPDWDTATWQLLADLRIDQILALSQVRRRYAPGADEQEVRRWLKRLAGRRAITVRRVWVPPSARARLTEEILAVEEPGRASRQENMAHRLGLAEMRWHLRATLERWELVKQPWPEKQRYGERPDVLAEDAAGFFVVEYDHGAYSVADVKNKQRAFSELAPRQVWGVSSERRRCWIRRYLENSSILVVAW